MKPFLTRLKVLFLLPLLATSALAAGKNLEIVQSVPIETTLAAPGIRHTQAVWLEMINGAKSTIDLEQFYIQNGEGGLLEPVLQALRSAAARGVKVRFLVDSVFFKKYPGEPKALAEVKNIEVKQISFGSGIQHAKFFIVDGVNLYAGSANFDYLALQHIHEIGLHIQDQGVAENFTEVFEKDWGMGVDVGEKSVALAPRASAVRPSATMPGLSVMASPENKNPEGMADSLTEMLKAMDAARSTLRIQVYQYSTKASGKGKWLELDNALRRAAQRGVKVQLMVDNVAMKNSAPELRALAGVPNIEVRTVIIPEWSGGHLDYARLIHSKYFVADDTSWVGSENWSENYFSASRNVGIILKDAAVAKQLNDIFARVWGSAYAKAL